MDIAADKIFSVFSYVFEKCLDIFNLYALHFTNFADLSLTTLTIFIFTFTALWFGVCHVSSKFDK